MLDILSDYKKEIDEVIEENPISRLEKILNQHIKITPGDVIGLKLKLKKQWDKVVEYEIEMCVILTEETSVGEELIYQYNFEEDIRTIIQGGKKGSNIYYLNMDYAISDKKMYDEILSVERCSEISKKLNKIVLHLGVHGIDIFVDGVIFQADNFLHSYKDVIYAGKMLSIYDYDKLLKDFYIENIQFDINKRYFLRKNDVPKEYHSTTIDKYPKILKNSPEEYFQLDFVKYLKDHCSDAVIKEYRTVSEDRYDVLVLGADSQVYVFEIKWLGRSITKNMKILEYNTDERAISGAYQLLDYVNNATKYKKYFLEYPIYCAVLLVFDARDNDVDIKFPEDIKGKANIDLGKRFFMHKEKINASKVYVNKRR